MGWIAPVNDRYDETGGEEQRDHRSAKKGYQQEAMALPQYRESLQPLFPTEFSLSPAAGLDSYSLWLSIVRDHLNGKGTLRQ